MHFSIIIPVLNEEAVLEQPYLDEFVTLHHGPSASNALLHLW